MAENSYSGKYIEGIGRRKTATARVRIYEPDGTMQVNGKPYQEYFTTDRMRKIVSDAFRALELKKTPAVSVHVQGGGLYAQAEAIRHGLSRALITKDDHVRAPLKSEGYLKRDPRMKERKKFGHHKARKSPQWSKR